MKKNKLEPRSKVAYYPLTLTARRGNWQLYVTRKFQKRFKSMLQQILTRDHNTCQYCGFEGLPEFLHVVNLDHDYKNNKADNLITACSLCAQCFFLDSLALDGRTGGTIVHVPELRQIELNHFCRILFCSLDRETPYKSRLQALYLTFRERSKSVEFCFGPDSSQPRVFGQAMIDAHLRPASLDHPLLGGLRLLPARHMFLKEIEYWKRHTYADVPL